MRGAGGRRARCTGSARLVRSAEVEQGEHGDAPVPPSPARPPPRVRAASSRAERAIEKRDRVPDSGDSLPAVPLMRSMRVHEELRAAARPGGARPQAPATRRTVPRRSFRPTARALAGAVPGGQRSADGNRTKKQTRHAARRDAHGRPRGRPVGPGPGDHPDEPNPRGGVKARDRGDGAARRITPDRSVAMPARGSRVAIR